MAKNVMHIQVFLKDGTEIKGTLESKDSEVYLIRVGNKVVPVFRRECTQVNMSNSGNLTQVRDIKGDIRF